MLNYRVICLVVLCVLFVAAAYGQDQSDPNIITVVKKIDVAKLNENVEDLNENVATLTQTISKLGDNVETLNDTVTRLDERTKWIGNLQYVILAAVLGGQLLGTILVYRRFSKDNEGAKTVDRLADQITNLTSAQAETSAQITKLISAQMEISATRSVSWDPEVPSLEDWTSQQTTYGLNSMMLGEQSDG
jgi:uncharacterized phage infection (PIP) family protein YhgE